MAVTIRDVARRAGLSVATVSRTLDPKHQHMVAPDTRERVEEVVKDLGYVTHTIARGLSSRATKRVLILTDEVQPAFFAKAMEHLTVGARLMDLEPTVDEYTEPSLTGDLPAMRHWPVDGAISFGGSVMHAAKVDLLRKKLVPMVHIGGVAQAYGDNVLVDIAGGADQAVEHLWAQGRRRIALLADRISVQNQGQRAQRYLDFAKKRDFQPQIVICEELNRSSGRLAMANLAQLNPLPDALYCLNDEAAIGALRGLHDRGLKVPDDVAVIGFDGIEDAGYHVPSLSTVQYPIAQAAGLALEYLQRRLAGDDALQQLVQLPMHLIVRESTGGTDPGPGH